MSAGFIDSKTDKNSGCLVNVESIAWIDYEPVSGGQMRADVHFRGKKEPIQLFGDSAEKLMESCRRRKLKP